MLDLAAAVQQWADRLAAEILSRAAPAGSLESAPESAVVALYLAVMVVLAGYGLHRYQLIHLYFRHRGSARPEPSARFDTLPAVTVQLPIYNEQFVVEQLIESVCRLDYPRERLQIQVLDDSTDETETVARAAVARWAALGYPVEYIHRGHREGFKAGALENGLARARGELIAVFDADFEPSPDFLHQTVHYFTDPQVGMVQGRWDLPQSRALVADARPSRAARRPLRLRAWRPRALGTLLQLQWYGRRASSHDDRRRRRLAARHADRRHRPELPRADAGMEVSNTRRMSRWPRSCRRT